MTRLTLPAILALPLCLALACGAGGGSAASDFGASDASTSDVPTATDVGYADLTATDTASPDTTTVDPGTVTSDAVVADTTPVDTQTIEDTAGDPGVDAGCGPVTCTLACPNGFVKGPDGCPTCQCQPCSDDLQCMKFKQCPTHQAGVCAKGECGCACSSFVCNLSCPLGFAEDDYGCAYCACAKCEYDYECAAMNCADATCRADGVCVCGCEQPKADYECPDGSKVPHCDCTALGFACVERPELQCPGVCHEGQTAEWPCPDGQVVPWCTCKVDPCAPACQAVGSFSEGWYDGCTGEKIAWSACNGCQPVCKAIGSKSEGWYDSCSGKLIRYQSCGPRFDCAADPQAACTEPSAACQEGATTTWTCPDGKPVPFCECSLPGAKCAPVCSRTGTAEEGWYDGCTDELIQKQKCEGCELTCDKVGSKSEGWYSSCTGLIRWAACGSAEWSCAPEPWKQCATGLACAAEGEGYNLSGGFGMCCPGLVAIEKAGWDGTTCSFVDCACEVCTQCGDGACNEPENPCNCPKDCGGSVPVGEPCVDTSECVLGLECIGPFPSASGGVCTQVCTPAADPVKQCGIGKVCLEVPDHQAPGFCMKACAAADDCAAYLTCGGAGAKTGCFPWSWCDPVLGDGCDAGQQCRIADGLPVCGGAGTLPAAYKCDPAKDMCGPGLVCAAGNTCRHVCGDDALCKGEYMNDLCVKKTPATPYGYCTTLE